MIKFFIVMSLFFIAMTILYIVEKRTASSKIVRQKLDDQDVIKAFESTSMTGKDFLKKVLAMNNINYKVIQAKKSKTVWCLPGCLVVSPSFNDPLTVETFNTSLHELKHILDKKISYLKYFFDLICLVTFAVIMVNLLQIINVTNIRLFYEIGLITFIIISVLGFIGETRARRFVNSEYSKDILLKMNFQKNINQRVSDHLNVRIKNEIFWHNATSVSLCLCVTGMLLSGLL